MVESTFPFISEKMQGTHTNSLKKLHLIRDAIENSKRQVKYGRSHKGSPYLNIFKERKV